MDAKSILLIVLIVVIVGGLGFAIFSVLAMPVGTSTVETSDVVEETPKVEKEKPTKNEVVEDTNTTIEPEPEPQPEPNPEPDPESEESKTIVPYTLQSTGKFSYYNAKYTKYNDGSFQRNAQAHEENPDNNYVIEYAIPSSYTLENGEFISPDGELSIKAEVYPVEDFMPENKNTSATTPSEFLTYFASKLGEAEYYTRTIKLNDFSANSVVKDTGDHLITYCAYVYDGYVYYVQATATRDTYNSVNADMIKIFETIHICKEDEL